MLEAAAALGELGAHVEQVDPPLGDPRPLFDLLWETSMAAIAADLPAAWTDELQDGLRATIERGRERDAVALARAELERMRLGAAMGLFHEAVGPAAHAGAGGAAVRGRAGRARRLGRRRPAGRRGPRSRGRSTSRSNRR